MKISKKKKGISIVEEIASITIIMLVATVCLTSILACTKIIAKSGKRTTNVAEAQKQIGNVVQNPSVLVTDPNVKLTTKNPTDQYEMKIDLGTDLGTNTIKGNMITYIDSTVDPTGESKNKTSLSMFIPLP